MNIIHRMTFVYIFQVSTHQDRIHGGLQSYTLLYINSPLRLVFMDLEFYKVSHSPLRLMFTDQEFYKLFLSGTDFHEFDE